MLDFCAKTRIRVSPRDKRLFDITEVEITRVNCIYPHTNIKYVNTLGMSGFQHCSSRVKVTVVMFR